MPYRRNEDLPSQVRSHLPLHGREISEVMTPDPFKRVGIPSFDTTQAALCLAAIECTAAGEWKLPCTDNICR